MQEEEDMFLSLRSSPADSDCKCTISPGAAFYDGHFSPDIAAGTVEDFVGVAVLLS